MGSSSSSTGAGRRRARARATRWRSPELSVRPSWPTAVDSPPGRFARRSVRPTASSTRCRSSSDASGAPSRRFSASVALKRWGRCGSQEKWPRHAATVSAPLRRPSKDMVPSLGSTKRSNAASTVDLPAPDGPVSATRLPGGRPQRDARERGALPVLVVHAEADDHADPPAAGAPVPTESSASPPTHGSGTIGAAPASRAPRAPAPPPPALRCWHGTRRRRGAAG